MSTTRTGRCHCGAVTVTVPADASGVIVCHCEDCQRLHGNAFALFAARKDAVSWTGEEHIRWYDSSPAVQRSFCGVCGSRLCRETKGSGHQQVSVGLFGPTTHARIRKQVWTASKPDWYDLPATD